MYARLPNEKGETSMFKLCVKNRYGPVPKMDVIFDHLSYLDGFFMISNNHPNLDDFGSFVSI